MVIDVVDTLVQAIRKLLGAFTEFDEVVRDNEALESKERLLLRQCQRLLLHAGVASLVDLGERRRSQFLIRNGLDALAFRTA